MAFRCATRRVRPRIMRRRAAAVAGISSVACGTAVLNNRNDAFGENAGSGIQGLIRFTRSAYHASAVVLDWRQNLKGLAKDMPSYEKTRREFNQRAADRLLYVCYRHGGIYTKLGQYIATMNHVLPKEWTETLSVLHDKVAPMPAETAVDCVCRELGIDSVDEVFSSFESTPVAAASLAQVHRATLHTGETVAVKVQYPGLPRQVKGDLWTMTKLSIIMGKIFPDYEYAYLFPEFEQSITEELDFRQEARNANRTRTLFASDTGRTDVHVPIVYSKFSNKRLLVMEYVDGVKPTDIEGLRRLGMDPLKVARTISSIFSEMIFTHGFVHCDPHPGNMLITANGADGEHTVVVLDHGMYRRLTPKFRSAYCLLWKALLTRDTDLGEHAVSCLGVPHIKGAYNGLSLILTYRSKSSKARTGTRMTPEERASARAKFSHVTARDVNEFLEQLPRDLLFVYRCTNIVRSINKTLGGTSRDRFCAMGEAAMKGLVLSRRLKQRLPNYPYQSTGVRRGSEKTNGGGDQISTSSNAHNNNNNSGDGTLDYFLIQTSHHEKDKERLVLLPRDTGRSTGPEETMERVLDDDDVDTWPTDINRPLDAEAWAYLSTRVDGDSSSSSTRTFLSAPRLKYAKQHLGKEGGNCSFGGNSSSSSSSGVYQYGWLSRVAQFLLGDVEVMLDVWRLRWNMWLLDVVIWWWQKVRLYAQPYTVKDVG